MSELVEDAIASWCGDTVGQFWLIRNELQKPVELKFKFFSFNTFDVSQIFWQRVEQTRSKYSYCIFVNWLCSVSVCLILNNALCSKSWVFFCFYFVPHSPINIWYHMLYLLNIYNYITFTASLERVLFEFMQSFPVVSVLYLSDFVCELSLNSLDSLYSMTFAFHGFQSCQQYSSRGMSRDFKSLSMRERFRDWNTFNTQPILSLAFLTIFLIWNIVKKVKYS